MTIITKYKANDGREFLSEFECYNYEAFNERIKDAMRDWPEHPAGCDFENGSGYFQIPVPMLRACRVRLLDLAAEKTDHRWIRECYDESKHLSWAARIIDELPYDSLSRAFNRLMCVDSQNREWGQPYFAAHPEAAKNVCLNP